MLNSNHNIKLFIFYNMSLAQVVKTLVFIAHKQVKVIRLSAQWTLYAYIEYALNTGLNKPPFTKQLWHIIRLGYK